MPTNSRTYIVDIDGTLADLTHRLHFIQQEPKDWDGFYNACDEDAPIDDVIDVVRAIDFKAWHHTGYGTRTVFLTGRPERVREKTSAWLLRYGLAGELIMRKDGDHRPDTVAKRELLEALQADGGRVVGVFEDRPAMVRVWREMGLTVFQMNDKEF